MTKIKFKAAKKPAWAGPQSAPQPATEMYAIRVVEWERTDKWDPYPGEWLYFEVHSIYDGPIVKSTNCLAGAKFFTRWENAIQHTQLIDEQLPDHIRPELEIVKVMVSPLEGARFKR